MTVTYFVIFDDEDDRHHVESNSERHTVFGFRYEHDAVKCAEKLEAELVATA